ncbi:hypothetical protein [Cellulosilyticum ruminicola]|uniref:hypothetical protein n=1 Tax=Cellulosilyticum ruminicola TaxID=425254 RepID=UPI0006D15925|nr:hypothetical protein [Cellulosilyticum ruminicola]
MSEIPVVKIKLTGENTWVAPEIVPYNLEVEVDLSNIWEGIKQSETNYIEIYTYVQIPVLVGNLSQIASMMLDDSFKVMDIQDQKVLQYAYFGGVYDRSQAMQGRSEVWQYKLFPAGEED